MTNLTKAIIAVMGEVKSIDKNLSVGTGQNSYKGVADKDVKEAIGSAMQKHGLVILPIGIEPKMTVSEWDAEETWNGVASVKHKRQVTTEVLTKYLLMHTSGESMEVVGYGHGVDTQDKSAGKATTYALKNTLLYTFLVPTGSIDDADNTHSSELPTRPAYAKPTPVQPTTGLWCDYHKCAMRLNKNGKPYHRDGARQDGDQFCNGSGYPSEHDAHRAKIKASQTSIPDGIPI